MRIARLPVEQSVEVDDDVGKGSNWDETAVDIHSIESSIELGDECCPKIRRHIFVLHAHQRLLPRHAISQLPESIRLVERELPVLLLADAIDDGHDECLRREHQRRRGQ
jgi:hypothetical protein